MYWAYLLMCGAGRLLVLFVKLLFALIRGSQAQILGPRHSPLSLTLSHCYALILFSASKLRPLTNSNNANLSII